MIKSKTKQLVFQTLSLLTFVCGFGILVSPNAVYAQSIQGDDFSLFIGYMLPNQIEHVTEILPIFGGRYSFDLAGSGALEVEGANTHALGVDFTTLSLNLRGEVTLMPGINALIYGGPDFHYYAGQGQSRQVDYGVHFGAAGLMLIQESLWLRTDFKFLGNPGTALYLFLGLMFRTSAGS